MNEEDTFRRLRRQDVVQTRNHLMEVVIPEIMVRQKLRVADCTHPEAEAWLQSQGWNDFLELNDEFKRYWYKKLAEKNERT